MTILGEPVDHHHKYSFIVEIDDFNRAAFTKCSALEAEIAKILIWEGGSLVARKEPGRVTFSDVTLERGVTDDPECYRWFQDCYSAVKDTGKASPEFIRNADIVVLDRDRTELLRWTLEESWVTKFVAGEWDNEADEATMESITLTFTRFKRSDD